jgi:hypothetical protein
MRGSRAKPYFLAITMSWAEGAEKSTSAANGRAKRRKKQTKFENRPPQ